MHWVRIFDFDRFEIPENSKMADDSGENEKKGLEKFLNKVDDIG